MKVWWCEEHLCGNLPNRDTEGWASVPGQSGVCFFAEEFGSETTCRMVEMQLVPADALVVVKENGEWSDSTVLAFDTAAHALVETHHGREDLRLAFNIFVAALADAASDSANV